MWRWTQRRDRAWTLAVSLLILALAPTPWPKVEFHNVRHHDEAGQVCEYHDHLLRWHPTATSGAAVAVLHWHWAWPSEAADDSEHDGTGPRLHAHLADDALFATHPTSVIVVDTSARSVVPPLVEPPCSLFLFDLPTRDLLALRSGDPPALTFSATFAPRASLTARLHRWSC